MAVNVLTAVRIQAYFKFRYSDAKNLVNNDCSWDCRLPHMFCCILCLYSAVGDPVASSVKKFAVPAIHTHTHTQTKATPTVQTQVNLDNNIGD